MDSPLDIFKKLRERIFQNRVIDALLYASQGGYINIDPQINGSLKVYINGIGKKRFIGYYPQSKEYLVCRHPFERGKTFIINLPSNLLRM